MKIFTFRFIGHPETGKYIFQSQTEKSSCGAIPYSFLPPGSSLIVNIADN